MEFKYLKINAIIESQKLNQSLRTSNPNDARYGNGVWNTFEQGVH